MRKSSISKFNIFYILTIASILYLTGFMFLPKTAKCSETWFNHANDITFLQTGDGSLSSPYQISTAEQLASFANLVLNDTTLLYNEKNYILSDNINLSAYEWIPIGNKGINFRAKNKPFKGIFDGNGCTISGIKINSSSSTQYAGLFGYTLNATIKNLIVSGENNLSNVVANSYSANTYAGGVVAYAENTIFTNITNLGINVYSFSEYQYSYAGGIVGYSSSCIFNQTSNYANVLSYVRIKDNNSSNFTEVCSYSGGIIGKAEGTSSGITYARNNGKISAFTNGYYIKSKYFLGNPIGQLQMQIGISYAGGIVGKTNYLISLSFNSAEILSGSQNNFSYDGISYNVSLPKESYAGGITGFSSNIIDNTFNTGEITAVAETFNTSSTEVLPYTFPNSEYRLCTGNFGANSDKVLCTGQTNRNTYDYLQLKDVGSVSLKTMYAYAGGIAGSSTNSISNSYNDGTINGGKIEKTIALSIYYYVRYRYNNWGWKTVSKNLYFYVSISYYDTLFYGAINGDRSISTENTYASSTLINYYKKINVNCYEYDDSQTNNITVTKTYLAKSDSAQALLLTPSGHNSISLKVKGTTTMKYFDAITFRFNISRNDNNVIINFGSEWKHNCPGEPEDMCVINSSNYTIMENNYVNQNINHSITTSTNLLPNMLGSFWEKVNGVNGNRPYIKNFYW